LDDILDGAFLAVTVPDFVTFFELKSFVCLADANKIAKFPKQIAQLESLAHSRAIKQGIAFCTFCGYANDRVQRLSRGSSRLRGRPEVSPQRQGQPLRFMFASIRSN